MVLGWGLVGVRVVLDKGEEEFVGMSWRGVLQ